MDRMYICIDLKSFYASVECAERGIDPMKARLVVADPTRTDRSICLAVSPAMKALGVRNRCRVYEIPKSIDYIMAPPRMRLYIDYSARIYGIYLKFFSKDDIHVYSVDEAFIDVTEYYGLYGDNPKAIAVMVMEEIARELNIRATCGIGTNLYLTKIALDIVAKHAEDFIGYLDEESYREKLWNHRPITDFWMIGRGISRRLAKYGIFTMGEIAHTDEDFLYKLFGIDAELLIDHAWGREPVTMKDIKAFKPKSNSLSTSQVLKRDYSFGEALVIAAEMADVLCIDMVGKGINTESVSIYVGYSYAFGMIPGRGTIALGRRTNSSAIIIDAVKRLFMRVTARDIPVRRVGLSFNNIQKEERYDQLTVFDFLDNAAGKDRRIQNALIDIRKKYGANAVFRGIDLTEGATTLERNHQIGGHRSGD